MRFVLISILSLFSYSLSAQFECTDFSHDFDTEGCVTSIVSSPNDEKIVLYPNPVQDELNIQTETDRLIEVYDLYGRLLKTVKGKKVDVSDLSQGNYLIVIDRRLTAKFIKI